MRFCPTCQQETRALDCSPDKDGVMQERCYDCKYVFKPIVRKKRDPTTKKLTLKQIYKLCGRK